MTTGAGEEIRLGGLAIRFLVEGAASGGSVAMFEFSVAAGAKVPIAHSHDAYEETVYGSGGGAVVYGGWAVGEDWAGGFVLHTAGRGAPVR